MYVSALIVCSVVFYILYVDGPPTHPGQYLWHRLPYATSRPRLAYRRYLSFSVCMCFCLLAHVSLDQTCLAFLAAAAHVPIHPHSCPEGEAHVSTTYSVSIPTPEVRHQVPVRIKHRGHQLIGPAPAAQGSAADAFTHPRHLHDRIAREYLDVQANLTNAYWSIQ